MKEKIFAAFGCSFTWGQGLYYYDWIKKTKMTESEIKDFMLTDMAGMHKHWPALNCKVTNRDLENMRNIRYTTLLSKKLGMDYICNLENGGNNYENIDKINYLLKGIDFKSIGYLEEAHTKEQLEVDNSIYGDKLLNKDIKFIILQLTSAERDMGDEFPLTDEELNKINHGSGADTSDSRYKQVLYSTIKYVDRIYDVCKERNIQFLVWSWPADLGYVFKDKKYFVKIKFNDMEYNSHNDLEEEYPEFTLDGDLRRFGIDDEHPSKRFHILISEVILDKLEK
jgi:hypothetical protein